MTHKRIVFWVRMAFILLTVLLCIALFGIIPMLPRAALEFVQPGDLKRGIISCLFTLVAIWSLEKIMQHLEDVANHFSDRHSDDVDFVVFHWPAPCIGILMLLMHCVWASPVLEQVFYLYIYWS